MHNLKAKDQKDQFHLKLDCLNGPILILCSCKENNQWLKKPKVFFVYFCCCWQLEMNKGRKCPYLWEEDWVNEVMGLSSKGFASYMCVFKALIVLWRKFWIIAGKDKRVINIVAIMWWKTIPNVKETYRIELVL